MTPAQLEHLKLIDAHLDRPLETASKRTPGSWDSHPETLSNGRLFNTINADESFVTHVCSTNFVHEDASFIASCAGNAEAGWRSTKATVALLLLLNRGSFSPNTEATNLLNEILAACPLELITKHQ